MSDLKYIPIFEIAKCQMLQRDEIDISGIEEYFDVDRPAYLYCILSKNRVAINHKHIEFTDTDISFEFLFNKSGEFVKNPLKVTHTYNGLKELKISSSYPYNEFYILDELGSKLIGGKTAYIAEHEDIYEQILEKDLLDYEILYIGQSVTEANNVPALKRTLSHETFQKILEEYNRLHPDKELFTFFFSFKQKALIDFPEIVDEEKRKTFYEAYKKNYFHPTLKEIKQNVSLFEAALINYFKPKYNSDFVNNPPGKEHTSFSGLHEMNLTQVIIMFGIEDFFPKLYTDTAGRKDAHEIDLEIK